MVDVDKIKGLIEDHFHIHGLFSVDSATGTVDVDGHVEVIPKRTKLPVKFGKVSGGFLAQEVGLTSLEGFPHTVGGVCYVYRNNLRSLKGAPNKVGRSFSCHNNLLTDLKGAPQIVGSDFRCHTNPLNSLEGAPNSLTGEGMPAEFDVTYSSYLPLLRLLQYTSFHIGAVPATVEQILLKYAGTGKKGMLGAAVELTKAGYKANARW
jgi:hypothetical protein